MVHAASSYALLPYAADALRSTCHIVLQFGASGCLYGQTVAFVAYGVNQSIALRNDLPSVVANPPFGASQGAAEALPADGLTTKRSDTSQNQPFPQKGVLCEKGPRERTAIDN